MSGLKSRILQTIFWQRTSEINYAVLLKIYIPHLNEKIYMPHLNENAHVTQFQAKRPRNNSIKRS